MGAFELNGETFSPDEFAYLGMKNNSIELNARKGSRGLLIGGAPLNEEILIWWNFVGHTRLKLLGPSMIGNKGRRVFRR